MTNIEEKLLQIFQEEYEKRFPSSNITSSIVDHEPITKEDIISKIEELEEEERIQNI